MNVSHDAYVTSALDILQTGNTETGLFPFSQLHLNPVSTIEHLALKSAGLPRGICAVGCLGCCANAAPGTTPAQNVASLEPSLLNAILLFAGELAKENVHILSTVRLSLHNGSNELDNPDCLALRRGLSAYFEKIYGFPLGWISSDVAFHISGTSILKRNLLNILAAPTLWDNICFSIDEQIPTQGESDYQLYLENLSQIWKLLRPAITCQLDHARKVRLGQPRIVINMLVPPGDARFRDQHHHLYPGGPVRATTFEDLVERYIRPFVGDTVETTPGLPSGHRFTSGVARLSAVRESSVYIAYNRYMQTGRSPGLIRFAEKARSLAPASISTKIYPAGEKRFRFKACFTTAPFADDEVTVPLAQQPPWFRILNGLVIDAAGLGSLQNSPQSAAARI